MAVIDDLPPEIIDHVMRLNCTDKDEHGCLRGADATTIPVCQVVTKRAARSAGSVCSTWRNLVDSPLYRIAYVHVRIGSLNLSTLTYIAEELQKAGNCDIHLTLIIESTSNQKYSNINNRESITSIAFHLFRQHASRLRHISIYLDLLQFSHLHNISFGLSHLHFPRLQSLEIQQLPAMVSTELESPGHARQMAIYHEILLADSVPLLLWTSISELLSASPNLVEVKTRKHSFQPLIDVYPTPQHTSTLSSLSLTAPIDELFHTIESINFPRLQDLSLTAVNACTGFMFPETPLSFPLLTHLHLGGFGGRTILVFLESIEMPLLDTLRVDKTMEGLCLEWDLEPVMLPRLTSLKIEGSVGFTKFLRGNMVLPALVCRS